MPALEILGTTIRIIALILVHWIVGFVPGYYLGILIANRLFAKDNPTRMEKHQEVAEQAIQHNQQWHPDDPRWQK